MNLAHITNSIFIKFILMNNKVENGKAKLKKVGRRNVKSKKTRRKPKNEEQKSTNEKQRYYTNCISNHNNSYFNPSTE